MGTIRCETKGMETPAKNTQFNDEYEYSCTITPKPFLSFMAHWLALISVPVAVRETSAYTKTTDMWLVHFVESVNSSA